MEGNFNGIYRHHLDAKGRLSVPAKFRDILGSRFMIGIGTGDCLLIYTMEDWKNFEQKLRSEEILRWYGMNTLEVEVDAQGRIILPQQLREAGGITKNVVFAGRIDRAELWSEEAFDEHMRKVTKKDIREAAARLYANGIQF